MNDKGAFGGKMLRRVIKWDGTTMCNCLPTWGDADQQGLESP